MPLDKIRTLPIFDGLTPGEFDRIARGLEEMRYEPGEVIVSEDEDAAAPLFFAWTGAVQVVKRLGDGGERELATLTAPTIFGELELLTEIPFSATLKAAAETRAYAMTRQAFHELRGAGDAGLMKMIFNMAKILAMRLYHTNKALSEASSPTSKELSELRKTALTWVL